MAIHRTFMTPFDRSQILDLVTALDDTPVGRYRYTKRLRKGAAVECEVEVYPLAADSLLEKWPERAQRHREWFTLAQAALVIDDGELVPLLLILAAPE